MPASGVGSPMGGASKPVAAGPVAALCGEAAQVEELRWAQACPGTQRERLVAAAEAPVG